MANDFLNERKKRIEQYRTTIRQKEVPTQRIDIPDGLFVQCESCGAALYQKQLELNLMVCPHCQFHFKLKADQRLQQIADHNSFHELFANLSSVNPLGMPDYEQKLAQGMTSSGHLEAFVCGTAEIGSIPVAIGILDAHFMMGSMGSVVGEKVTRLIEHATRLKLPLVIFSASGGARMQEGILSLMQMVKTSAALKRHDQAKLLYISVLTHPTTGGVAASFASLGDINIAEKSALIGFAGARVIKQTIQQDLPEGFQTAGFQLNHGQVDLVVPRKAMKNTLFMLLDLHQKGDAL